MATGVVERSNTSRQDHAANDLNETDLAQDMIGQVFEQCLASGDITGIHALACTNKHFNKIITLIVEEMKLEQLCPLLKIISVAQAQRFGFQVTSPSVFPKLRIIKAYEAIAPHVEGKAGVTYFNFILPRHFTLRDVVEIVKGQGIEVNMPMDQVLPEIGDVPLEPGFPCMLVNNVFNDSRKKSFDDQCALAYGHGCELPTVEQYTIQIALIQKIFNQCLFGRDPATQGRALTHVKGQPLLVGGSTATSLTIVSVGSSTDLQSRGAGGRWKF